MTAQTVRDETTAEVKSAAARMIRDARANRPPRAKEYAWRTFMRASDEAAVICANHVLASNLPAALMWARVWLLLDDLSAKTALRRLAA